MAEEWRIIEKEITEKKKNEQRWDEGVIGKKCNRDKDERVTEKKRKVQQRDGRRFKGDEMKMDGRERR